MGDDLAGSKVGEGFEFALDMSDNIDGQPFLLFHDQGSMVVTIMSEVLQAFLDDAPFCGVPQEVSVFRTLLMQDTCRDGDDLVENKTVCSEQSVFGNFKLVLGIVYPSLILQQQLYHQMSHQALRRLLHRLNCQWFHLSILHLFCQWKLQLDPRSCQP